MAGLLVYTGKAGAGATTCAAATARRWAASGQRTALVSLDPTASLSTTYGTHVGPEPTAVAPGLTAVEISPEAGQETFEDCFEKLASVASVAGIDLDDGHVASLVGDTHLPFGPQVAALEAVASFVGDSSYDTVVFDTGMEGRVLRLLRTPGLLGIGLDVASMAASEAHERIDTALAPVVDPVTSRLPGADAEQPDEADVEAVEARVGRVREVLHGEGRRELRVVTTPDRVASRWTEHLVINLRNAGIPAGPLVVNKVIEDGDCCRRCRTVAARQREVLSDLREWEDLDLVVLPDLAGEAAGEAMLDRLADRLVG